jgi:hypothetical protein
VRLGKRKKAERILIFINCRSRKNGVFGQTLNNEKITIYPCRYYVYQSDIGEKVNVSIGGIFGSGYTRKGEEGKVSIYLSLGGFNVRPGVGISGGVGLRFSAGEIYPLDMNFGQFLTEILEEQE